MKEDSPYTPLLPSSQAGCYFIIKKNHFRGFVMHSKNELNKSSINISKINHRARHNTSRKQDLTKRYSVNFIEDQLFFSKKKRISSPFHANQESNNRIRPNIMEVCYEDKALWKALKEVEAACCFGKPVNCYFFLSYYKFKKRKERAEPDSFRAIYNKFIKDDARFLLNLPYAITLTAETVYSKIENMDEWESDDDLHEAIQALDAVYREVSKIMIQFWPLLEQYIKNQENLTDKVIPTLLAIVEHYEKKSPILCKDIKDIIAQRTDHRELVFNTFKKILLLIIGDLMRLSEAHGKKDNSYLVEATSSLMKIRSERNESDEDENSSEFKINRL
ncbi:hypothetical protein [Legionella feeleii]|nr:hypothetical protein [Legionella feeleii]